jgi:hypothetical protein
MLALSVPFRCYSIVTISGFSQGASPGTVLKQYFFEPIRARYPDAISHKALSINNLSAVRAYRKALSPLDMVPKAGFYLNFKPILFPQVFLHYFT